MGFGGPRSSCVRPGVHSALRQDSRNNLTPRCMAFHFVSAGAHAPHSDETLDPTATRGSSYSARRSRSLAFLCSSVECVRPYWNCLFYITGSITRGSPHFTGRSP